MKELKITQDAVLKAAEQNKDLAGLLQTLFPDAFEEEDTLAIMKGVFNGAEDDDLSRFCEKAFGRESAIRINYGCALNENHKLRSLFVIGYDVVTVETESGNTIIEFHHRR